MNSEQVPLQSNADPALLRFTEALTNTPDAGKADGIADMLLIFLSAGGRSRVFFWPQSCIYFSPHRKFTPLPGCSSYW
jgi:hypothetical protein